MRASAAIRCQHEFMTWKNAERAVWVAFFLSWVVTVIELIKDSESRWALRCLLIGWTLDLVFRLAKRLWGPARDESANERAVEGIQAD